MVGVLPSATDPASRVPNFLKHYFELPWAAWTVSLSFFALRSDIWAPGYFNGLLRWLTPGQLVPIDIHLDQGIKLDNHHILSRANLRSLGGELCPTVRQGDGEHDRPESLARLNISKLVRWQSDQETSHLCPPVQLNLDVSRYETELGLSLVELQRRDMAGINKIYQTI